MHHHPIRMAGPSSIFNLGMDAGNLKTQVEHVFAFAVPSARRQGECRIAPRTRIRHRRSACKRGRLLGWLPVMLISRRTAVIIAVARPSSIACSLCTGASGVTPRGAMVVVQWLTMRSPAWSSGRQCTRRRDPLADTPLGPAHSNFAGTSKLGHSQFLDQPEPQRAALLGSGSLTGGRVAAPAFGLHGRAGDSAVGAKHATVARLRFESRAATPAVMEILAGVGRHDLGRTVTAGGTGQCGL